jgi:hypothetical protein
MRADEPAPEGAVWLVVPSTTLLRNNQTRHDYWLPSRSRRPKSSLVSIAFIVICELQKNRKAQAGDVMAKEDAGCEGMREMTLGGLRRSSLSNCARHDRYLLTLPGNDVLSQLPKLFVTTIFELGSRRHDRT